MNANQAPATGELLGEGCFAQVYEDPENSDFVLKRTTCSATIGLLRSLIDNPQAGLPVVESEVFQEDFGAAWFRIERLYAVPRGSSELEPVSQALQEAYKHANDVEDDDWREFKLVRKFAFELRLRGQRRLARGAAHLAQFLQRNPLGGLDLQTSSNLMLDGHGRMVLADPVSVY